MVPFLILALASAAVPDSGASAKEAVPERDPASELKNKLPFNLVISGNDVFTEDTYLAMLDLAPDAKPNASTADLIENQIDSFLKRSGYQLATVHAVPFSKGVYVSVDEGHLEKVVFRGRLTFQMMRLKLALSLPRDVFNRPSLDRQLELLSEQLHIEKPKWELVKTANIRHVGPQLTDLGVLGTFQGRALVRPQEQFELHVIFPEHEWSKGLGFDVRITYFDGFELGLNTQGNSAFFKDDRWRVAVMGGVGLREDILTRRLYAFPSRLIADGQWYGPAVDSQKRFRPFISLFASANARQRRDLNLENYFSTTNELTFNLSIRGGTMLTAFFGVGLQHFQVFAPRAPDAQSPFFPVDARIRFRPFIELRGDLTFHQGDGRWDRRHGITLSTRVSSNIVRPELPAVAEVRALYQFVRPIGWHDFWIRARGSWMWGDVLFHFEEPLGEYIRGIFGDVFVRNAIGARGEFRFSLTRDVYKIGVFVDTALYGEQDRFSHRQVPRGAFAAGPSFHALIEGMFQIDLALTFGWRSSPRFETGVTAQLIKVF